MNRFSRSPIVRRLYWVVGACTVGVVVCMIVSVVLSAVVGENDLTAFVQVAAGAFGWMVLGGVSFLGGMAIAAHSMNWFRDEGA